MNIRDKSTVVLDRQEEDVRAIVDILVGKGNTPAAALVMVLPACKDLDPNFVAWLTDGEVVLDD